MDDNVYLRIGEIYDVKIAKMERGYSYIIKDREQIRSFIKRCKNVKIISEEQLQKNNDIEEMNRYYRLIIHKGQERLTATDTDGRLLTKGACEEIRSILDQDGIRATIETIGHNVRPQKLYKSSLNWTTKPVPTQKQSSKVEQLSLF